VQLILVRFTVRRNRYDEADRCPRAAIQASKQDFVLSGKGEHPINKKTEPAKALFEKPPP